MTYPGENIVHIYVINNKLTKEMHDMYCLLIGWIDLLQC